MNIAGKVISPRTNPSDIVEFYHQLALLVRARLPLPSSLQQLAKFCGTPKFRAALHTIAQRTEEGQPLSEALRQYPAYFSALHVRLVNLGETSGTLPAMLFTVAKLAQFSQSVTGRMAEVAAYPAFVILFGFTLLIGLSSLAYSFILGVLEDLDKYYIFARYFPAIMQVLVPVGAILHNHFVAILICGLVVLVALGLILRNPLWRHRLALALIRLLPGARQIAHTQDCARLCRIWATLIRQKVPMPETLEISSGLVNGRSLQRALEHACEKIRQGGPMAEALAEEPAVDQLIVMAFRNSTEETLAEDFGALADLFEIRTTRAASRMVQLWAGIMFLCMVLSAALVGFAGLGFFKSLFVIRDLFKMGLM